MFKFHRSNGKHVAAEHTCPLAVTLPTVGRHVDARTTAKFIVAGAKVQAEAIIAEGKAQAESVLKADAELRVKLAQMTADAKAEADAKAKAQRDAQRAADNAIADWRYEAARADRRERKHQVRLAKAQNATAAMRAAADEKIAAFNAQAASAAAANDTIDLAFQASEIQMLAEQVAKLAGDLAAKQVEKDLADLAIQHLIDRTVPAAA
jgi:hypothetical protein